MFGLTKTKSRLTAEERQKYEAKEFHLQQKIEEREKVIATLEHTIQDLKFKNITLEYATKGAISETTVLKERIQDIQEVAFSLQKAVQEEHNSFTALYKLYKPLRDEQLLREEKNKKRKEKQSKKGD